MAQHDGAAAIRIMNRHAALYAARLQPGQSVQLPEAPFLHLFVPRGEVTVGAVVFALLLALVFALTFGLHLGAAYIDQVTAR